MTSHTCWASLRAPPSLAMSRGHGYRSWRLRLPTKSFSVSSRAISMRASYEGSRKESACGRAAYVSSWSGIRSAPISIAESPTSDALKRPVRSVLNHFTDMMHERSRRYRRLLSIDPSVAGFGFAVIEGGNRLVDWGVARIWSRNDQEFLARIESMIDRYRPALVVLEDRSGSRRRSRSLRRLRLVASYCVARPLPIAFVTRRSVRQAFGESGRTKHDIATAIVMEFRELESRLPKPRKAWMPEDEQMNIFDAISFVVALRGADLSSAIAAP